MSGGAWHVQVLTEDGEGAYAPLQGLILRMMAHGKWWIKSESVTFSDAPEGVRKAFRGDERKRKTGSRERELLFAQVIAEHLTRHGQGIFVVHVDADLPWTGSTRPPPNLTWVVANLVPKVKARLAAREQADRVKRLVVLVPYAHIESWYFQNIAELRRWYARHHPGEHPDLEHIQRWEADPGRLDEECEPGSRKPKHLLVVGSQHNVALAHDFPVERALSAGKSFAAACETLLAVPGLKDWIDTLRPTWAQEPP